MNNKKTSNHCDFSSSASELRLECSSVLRLSNPQHSHVLHLQGFQIRQIFRPRNCRRAANTGDKISFHYIASIARNSPTGTGGTQFDATADFKPIEIVLSERNLIQGLYHGLLGACDMEKRVLTIPAEWAFGEKGHLDVPGGATVVFSIHVIGVEPHVDMFAEMDLDRNGCVDQEEVKVWLRNQRVSATQVDDVSTRIMYYDDKDKDGWITCTLTCSHMWAPWMEWWT